jgi:2-polyprenyl-3-methyl-5-hydroxy-6-metoxy-1,4-benzoquinol methylase
MTDITNDQNIQDWSQATDFILKKVTDLGDFYRQHVINPALFSLLGEVKGKTIFDAGCGEGYLSRMLAKQGAIVTGLEPAEGLVNYAIERETKENLGITYIKEDLSKWKDKLDYFDIVISNMVFMDIPDYKSAMKNCISVLKSKGIFIFSISHPCFDTEGHWEEELPYVKVQKYFDEYKMKNYIGYSFHHMLSEYINLVTEEGCVIAKILEPRLPIEIANTDKKYQRDKNIANFLLVKAVKQQLH